MLAVKLPKLETVEIVEEPIPVPKKGEVLIKMKASALCRSDLHRYHGNKLFDEDRILLRVMNRVELLRSWEKESQK